MIALPPPIIRLGRRITSDIHRDLQRALEFARRQPKLGPADGSHNRKIHITVRCPPPTQFRQQRGGGIRLGEDTITIYLAHPSSIFAR